MASAKNAQSRSAVACTACSARIETGPVETSTEPVFHRTFELYRCSYCGVTFTQPQDDFPLKEWYAKAAYLYGEIEYSVRETAEKDWRFRRFNKLAGKFGLHGRLLDVGCGDGRFLIQQSRWGWTGSLKGLDFSSEMAQRLEPGFDVEVMPFEAFVPKGSRDPFDVVTLFDVLEHFARPAAALSGVRQLIKPGGVLLVSVPNSRRLRFFCREEYDFPPHHFTRWTAAALSGMIRGSGFELLAVQTSFFGPGMISEQIFYPLFWKTMPIVKRLLFGGQASSGKTLTELLEANQTGVPNAAKSGSTVQNLIGSKGTRKKIESFLRRTFNIVTYPLFLPVCWILAVVRPDSGDHLLVMARRAV